MNGDSDANQDQPPTTDEPVIASADAVIPPPPPEIPIPDDLLTPPLTESSVPDAVIPPPPPETRRRSAPRPTPAALAGEQPAAAAEDWAQPSVAPKVPTSGGYRGLTIVIFVFLFVLLVAAIGVLVYLVNSGTFPFVALDVVGVPALTAAGVL